MMSQASRSIGGVYVWNPRGWGLTRRSAGLSCGGLLVETEVQLHQLAVGSTWHQVGGREQEKSGSRLHFGERTDHRVFTITPFSRSHRYGNILG